MWEDFSNFIMYEAENAIEKSIKKANTNNSNSFKNLLFPDHRFPPFQSFSISFGSVLEKAINKYVAPVNFDYEQTSIIKNNICDYFYEKLVKWKYFDNRIDIIGYLDYFRLFNIEWATETKWRQLMRSVGDMMLCHLDLNGE